MREGESLRPGELGLLRSLWRDGLAVGDEDITTPRSNHPTIEQCRCHAPERTAHFERFDPEIKCDHEEKDCNGFVVVGSSYRT